VQSLVGGQIGSYRILSLLGAGGMGEVYRAHDAKLRRDVALKVLPRELAHDPERRTRLLQEARAAAALNHPNICTVHDVGETDGHAYIAMEAVEGQPLSARLANGPLPPAELLRYALQLAEAVAHAHDRGVVHRDLKSANVMITPEGRAKVLDFGLATRLIGNDVSDVATRTQTSLTEPGAIRGTLPYMAPEQLRGQPADARSDVWALGVVLYEMAAGARPFKGQSLLELSSAILHEPPSPLPSRVAAPLQTVIGRCLEKEPARRYQRAGEVQAALETLGSSAGRKTRVLFAVGTVLTLIAAALAALWINRPSTDLETTPDASTVTGVTPRRSVAVLGFKNLSGSPTVAWLSTAFSEILSTELAAGEQLRIVPGENVARMKADLALADAESYGADTLRRIRTNVGSDAVLVGSYLVVGDARSRRIRLDVQVQDVMSGETIAVVTDSGLEAELLDLVSRAGAQVRMRLGARMLSPVEAQAVRAAIPATTEAARLYTEGLMRLRRFETLAARQLLEKAIAADPQHPLAHAELAAAWAALGYVANAQQEARRAVDLSGRLSRAERLWVEGRYRETTREWPKAVEIYRTLFGFFPDNVDYGLQLTNAQTLAGQGRDALVTLDALRSLPAPFRDDPRIDLAEAIASASLTDFKRALAAALNARAKAAEQGARLLVAQARLQEGLALWNLGQSAEGIAATDDARRLFGEGGDRAGTARARTNMAIIYSRQDDFTRARQLYEEALETNRDIGNDGGVAFALNNLGNLLADQKRYAEARRAYDQALAIHRKTRSKAQEAGVLGNIANILQYQGQLAESRQMHEEALAAYRQVGARMNIAIELTNMAEVLDDQGDLAEARTLLDEALVIKREVGSRSSIAFTLQTLADVLLAQGDTTGARKAAEEAMALRQQLGEKLRAAENRLQLAKIALEEGRASTAESEAQAVAGTFRAEQSVEFEVDARGVWALAALTQGSPERARTAMEGIEVFVPRIATRTVQLRSVLNRARVDAASGRVSTALARTRSAIADARRFRLGTIELEARLVASQIEVAAGGSDRIRAGLQALEREAASKGQGLIVRRIRTLMAAL
jgi:serine/threonine protein kinase/tetratricopeptide (TPR) repeat protein